MSRPTDPLGKPAIGPPTNPTEPEERLRALLAFAGGVSHDGHAEAERGTPEWEDCPYDPCKWLRETFLPSGERPEERDSLARIEARHDPIHVGIDPPADPGTIEVCSRCE